MAHNINRNQNTNKDSFFSVKQKAWHGLGQIIENYPTSEEAIIHAGLDYEVEKRQIFTYSTGNFQNPALFYPDTEIKNFFATVRKDTDQILGVVGSKYEVVQNRTAFTFFDSLVTANNGIKYETAGALGNGERIFITAKMPEVIKVGRKDIIEEYIFLTTSHDGSGSIMAAFTPVRIVCNNTLNMALRDHSNAVFIKHTANAETKLKEAARIIAIGQNMGEQLEQMFNKWAKVKVNDAELKKLVRLAMSPNKEVAKAVIDDNKEFEFSKHFENVCTQVFDYAMISPTQQMETTAGTLFGAYNAITGYYQNVKAYDNNNAKVESIMFGTGLERTKKAFEICLKAGDYLN